MIACALALANVASASTSAGEDQYIEQTPRGGGETTDNNNVPDDVAPVDTNGDGTISEAEVKEAAEKNKKKAEKKKAKAEKDDEGATGSTGAVTSTTTPTPPAASSVATAAKFGPVSQKTAFIFAGFALLLLGAFALFGNGGSSLLARFGAESTPPTS